MSFKSKMASARRNSKVRIGIIIFLLVFIGILIYWVKSGTLKAILAVVFGLLLGAGTMEVTGHDYDVQKLAKTGSFEQSKIEKTESGFWKIGDDCTTNSMNCSDFQYQEDAQEFFESCGGVNNNINRLDGNDKDGIACESLPHKK